MEKNSWETNMYLPKLFVPRQEITLTETYGEVTYWKNTDEKIYSKPLITRTRLGEGWEEWYVSLLKYREYGERILELVLSNYFSRKTGCVAGWNSGYRSALDFVNGGFVKIKGCRPTQKDHHFEPHGGTLLYRVEREFKSIEALLPTYANEGIAYPQTPYCIFDYKKTFAIRDKHDKSKHPIVASVVKTLGDTRLDEYLFFLTTCAFPKVIPNELQEKTETILRGLGQWCGYSKQIMDNYGISWGTSRRFSNAHSGNFVLYEMQKGLTGAATIDLDATSLLEKSKKKIKRWQLEEFLDLQQNIGLICTSLYPIQTTDTKKDRSPIQIEFIDKVGKNITRNKNFFANLVRNGFREGYLSKKRPCLLPTVSIDDLPTEWLFTSLEQANLLT